MRLEPLYRLTFHYPESWLVELDDERGMESESFLIAEGRAEGRISGRMRGANKPRRRTDMTYLPDFNGDIVLDVAELVWEPLPDRPSYDSRNGD